jgi:UDP-glucose 4-epimerase
MVQSGDSHWGGSMSGFLVTGGCGFIGQHVVASLLRDGAAFVRIVDDLSHGTRANLEPAGAIEELDHVPNRAPRQRIQLIRAGIDNEAVAEAACRGVGAVIHLAANTGVASSVAAPREDCVTNVIGTLNYLEGARHAGVERFVFASSGATIGEVAPPIHELLAPRPVSPYGASKLAGEAYCSTYARTFGLVTVALRFGNVYGPGSAHKESVVAKYIRHAFKGEKLPIYGDGRQTRDFVYVDDLVRAIRLACSATDVRGEVFQIATARETTVIELATALSEALVAEGLADPGIDFQSARLGDVARNYADTTKARERLGWTTEVSLHEGLRRTVRWALESHRADRFPSQKQRSPAAAEH